MNLYDTHEISALLKKHRLNPKKYLGQHFLINETVVEKSLDAAELKATDHVIEIGPGLGTLTRALAARSHAVTTIELDHTLLPILNDTLREYPHVRILNQDALAFTPPETPYKVIANIPYNITSPLITHFLHAPHPPLSMTLLIQREVADKICLTEPRMSVLSLQVALFGTPHKIMNVSSDSFLPPPKVESAILHITAITRAEIPRAQAFLILKTAKRAFSQSRKKLSNTLPHLRTALDALSLAEKRPQHLSISDWNNLLISS